MQVHVEQLYFSILLPTLLNICLIFSVRLISFQVGLVMEKPYFDCKFLQLTYPHTFSFSPALLPSFPLSSSCLSFPLSLSFHSSLSSFLCSQKRLISIIGSDWFSCLHCLSYRDQCILMISRHSCKCQNTIHTKCTPKHTHTHTWMYKYAHTHSPATASCMPFVAKMPLTWAYLQQKAVRDHFCSTRDRLSLSPGRKTLPNCLCVIFLQYLGSVFLHNEHALVHMTLWRMCTHLDLYDKLQVCACEVCVYIFTIITSHTVAVLGCKPPTRPSNIISHQQHGTKRQKHDLFTEWNS